MTRDQAAKLLGCAVSASADEVRRAFAITARDSHPDSRPSHLLDVPAPDLRDLKLARDVLLTAAGEVRPATCPHCRGSGWVQVGFKQERCVRGC